MFYIRIKNAALPCQEDTESAFQKAHGTQDDLSLLRAFGSHIWVTELTPANIRGKYPVDTQRHLVVVVVLLLQGGQRTG